MSSSEEGKDGQMKVVLVSEGLSDLCSGALGPLAAWAWLAASAPVSVKSRQSSVECLTLDHSQHPSIRVTSPNPESLLIWNLHQRTKTNNFYPFLCWNFPQAPTSLRTASAILPKSHSHFCSNHSIHIETETINIYEQCGLFSAILLYPLVFGAPKGSSFKVNSDGQSKTKMEQRSTCLLLLEEM